MKQYLELIDRVVKYGNLEEHDRTGVGTLNLFSEKMVFDLSTGKFPLLTTKKVFFRGVIEELLFFLHTDGYSIDYLVDRNIHIWDAWPPSRESGKFIPYARFWRHYPKFNSKNEYIGEVDQIGEMIRLIKEEPGSRRIIVDSWNAGLNHDAVLTACHNFFQIYVRGEYLDMNLSVRSNDLFLGCPFNIASYSLLLMMIAQVTGKKPGKLYYNIGIAHVYLNHTEQINEQLTREPRELPVVKINPGVTKIDDFKIDDFELVGYNPWPAIKGEVAV